MKHHQFAGSVFVSIALAATAASAGVTEWTGENGTSIATGANWTTHENGDNIYLVNSSNAAALGDEESFDAGGKVFYVGRGYAKNDQGEWGDGTEYDKGATLNISGGLFTSSTNVWVGGVCSDFMDCILNISGGEMRVFELFTGNCASNADRIGRPKVNAIYLSGGTLATEGDMQLGDYWGSTNTLVQTGGTFQPGSGEGNHWFRIGQSGKATYDFNGGIFVPPNEVGVGMYPGSKGVFNINKAVALKTTHVGRGGGTGILNVNVGTTTLDAIVPDGNDWYRGLNLGWENGSKGYLNIAEGAEFETVARESGYANLIRICRDAGTYGEVNVRGTLTYNHADGLRVGHADFNNENETFAEGVLNNWGTIKVTTGLSIAAGRGSKGTACFHNGSVVCDKYVHVGASDNAVGMLSVTGGTFKTVCDGWWPGGLTIGWGSSTGTMKVARDADVEIIGGLFIGRDSGSDGTFEMSGGKVNVHEWNGGINIGVESGSQGRATISGGEFKSASVAIGEKGSGSLTVSGGKVDFGVYMWDNLRLGVSSGSEGFFHLMDGEVNVSGGISIGCSNGVGRLVMDGGKLKCAEHFGFNDNEFSEVTGSEAFLNGGELWADYISIRSQKPTSTATLNWNGCVMATTGVRNWDDQILPADERLTVNVLDRGMIIVATNKNIKIGHPLSGRGAFVKRGPNDLILEGEVSLARGFRVEEGKLAIASGKIARTNFKEILVADGCELDLGGAEVTVAKYTVAGVEKAAGDYQEQNGTIHVMSQAQQAPVTAVWSNAAGDGDAANPGNWSGLLTADGIELFDVLPTEATDVKIPSNLVRPDMSGLAVKSVTLVVSGNVSLRGDCTVPAIVKSAKAWYDFDDSASVTMEGGIPVGVANKGTAGNALDLVLYHPEESRRKPAYGLSSHHGRDVMSFTNSYGFVSKNSAGIVGDADRTLVAVSLRIRNTYPAFNDNGTPKEGEYEQQMFPLGIEKVGDNEWQSGEFRLGQWAGSSNLDYDDSTVTRADWTTQALQGLRDIDPDEYAIWAMSSAERTVSGSVMTESHGVENATSVTVGGNGTSEEAKLFVGMRQLYDSPSAGELAEAMMFDKALSDEELAAVRAYLHTKWFTPFDDTTVPSNLALENGARIDFGGGSWTFDKITGAGTIGNANVTVEGSVEPGLVVEGTVHFGANAGFDFSSIHEKPNPGVIELLTCTRFTGKAAIKNWNFPSQSIRLRTVDNPDGTVTVVADIRNRGMVIFVR